MGAQVAEVVVFEVLSLCPLSRYNPVPRRGDQGGFQGFPEGQNPAAFVEHSVEAEVLNSLILVVHALPQYRVKRLGLGFFGLFPVRRESECGAAWGSQLMDAGGL